MSPPPAAAVSSLRRHLAAIALLALLVRAVIGVWATGRGEMEGLSYAYEASGYALAAGYGFIRPVYGQPAEVDLPRLVAEQAALGRRVGPGTAPPITPTRWRPASLHPPGYAAFLCALYELTGQPVGPWARTLQALLDAGACVLVARIGLRLGGRLAALFAGYGSAVFPPLAYLVTSHVADSLTPPFVVLAFWLVLRGLDSHRLGWWIGAGAALASLWMLRPDYAALGPFLLLGAAVLRTGVRPLLLRAAVLLLTVALAVLPWALRNRRAIGEFTPGATSSGLVLMQSIGMFSNPLHIPLEDDWYNREAVRAGFESAEDPRAERMFRTRFLAVARTHPLLVARSWLLRLGLGLVPPYHWGYDNPWYKRNSYYAFLAREGRSPMGTLLHHPTEVLRAYWDRILFLPVSLLLLVGSIAGLVLARARWRDVAVALLPYAYVVLVHLPLYMTMRMLVPGVFGQLIMLGYWYERLVLRRSVRMLEI